MQASYYLVTFSTFMFYFVLFIYSQSFLSQSAEPATNRALENRYLTTVLKIIGKYPGEVLDGLQACNFTKNEHFYKYLSRHLISNIQLPVSKNISWWMLLKIVYRTAIRSGLRFLNGKKKKEEEFHFLLRIKISFKNYIFS